MDTLREILKDVNADIRNIQQHQGNNYLRNFMQVAYLKSHKIDLPEGEAPYTPSNIESEVQTKGVMWQFLKKLDTLRNPKLHTLKREMMFIDALENVTKAEAEVLTCMKDQMMYKLYPNITLSALIEVGYFPDSFRESTE
jgi:hypothetical protein